MIFQILLMNEIQDVFYYLQTAGILDILIPFVLIFTVLFAVMKKVHIFSEPKQQITIALAITLLVLIPHITGSVSPEYDVVQIINNSLPSVVLIIFVVLSAFILLGFVKGKEVALEDMATGVVAIVSLVLIGIIFARSAGYLQSSSWPHWLYWLDDPQLGALIIVILMFALIIWFITYESNDKKGLKPWLKKYLPEIGKQIWKE
ncbi:hypothetical protein GF358_02130 [Candidatus Woesearchaeota archaeon]|nr:hypothetical protein [Candidatus Woesearchaeota archaeon]